MRIGLTGGIASGKSTVANYLHERYGIPVLSADRYANFILENLVKDSVIDRYGEKIVREDKIDRRSLGQIIFTDPMERAWLESKIHPLVRELMQQDLAQYQERLVVLEIPLLFEAKMTDLVDQTWVVWCKEETMIARLQKRNHLTITECHDRINAQMPIGEKCKLADLILDNEGNLEQLYQKIDRKITELTSP